MMRSFTYGIAVLALLAVAPVARAHSLDEVESLLIDEEKYFQPLDEPESDFTLRTADDRIVRLADLRGNVVILHFIYTSCPDVCPLHAERLAEVQAMVNDTPMKDLVTFVTVTTDPASRSSTHSPTTPPVRVDMARRVGGAG
jgi:protein SCO1/2